MNSKMKKLLITGSLILLSIIMINTKVEARSLFGYGNQVKAAARGAPVDISSADVIDGEPGNNTFCVYVREDLFPLAVYDVVNYIHIDGLTSSIYENNQGRLLAQHNNQQNGAFAWILAQNDPGGFPYERQYSDKQNAVYGFFGEWLDANGLVFKHRNSAGGVTYTNEAWRQMGYDYARSYQNSGSASITNNIQGDVGVDTHSVNGEDYIKVGPLNWTFNGNVTSVDVYNQDNNTVPVKYGKYSGTNLEISDSKDIIKSGQDFYILVKNDGNIERISKIGARVTHQKQNIKADIWTLSRNGGMDNQNLITTNAEVTIETTTADLTTGPIDLLGNLNVVKVNKDNTQIKLKGVEFIIQRTNTKKYVVQNGEKITYTDSKEQATKFVTDDKGEIHIKKLIVGDYTAYETKNPNYGYEMIKDGIPLKVVVKKDDPIQIGNQQIYIKLSGYVWEDKIFGKKSEKNSLYKDNTYDINDKLMDGIVVRLKDKSGNTVKEVKTDKAGSYQFLDVLIADLANYYVEFEYDGLVYTNVLAHTNVDNGSKAAEVTTARNDFNMKFSSVENKQGNVGQTKDQSGNIAHELQYNKNQKEYESKLDHTKSVFNITANTNETGYNIREHFTFGQEEVKNINLGLDEREQPDLAVIKDIQNAIVKINGYQHTYNYEDRFKNQGEYEKGFNVGIKFANERGSQSYTRAIYKSDVNYVGNPERELKTYVTYKIRVVNESTNLKIKANSLVDYYDSGYTLVAAGTGVDSKGDITGELKHTDTGYNDKYKKTVIETTETIDPQKYTDVYVQFVMNRETTLKMMNQEVGADNIVEVNSYSVFDKEGKVYAGIDKDSAPGNAVPGEKLTYEDDTDKAPSFKPIVKDDRELEGVTFEDNAIDPGVGKIRQGSGTLNEGEHGIAGIDVTLKEISGAGIKDTTVTTDKNGNFKFTGFIPGKYVLVYTWGGQTYTSEVGEEKTYTVQNYKGTIFNEEAHQGNEWYKQTEPRYSDAIDNYNKDHEAPNGSRIQIDSELTDIGYGSVKDRKYKYTKMDSTTPEMEFAVEYDSTVSNSDEDKFVYKVGNVDFGIIQRALQNLAINKSVDTVKLTLANGTILSDAKIEIQPDGSKKLVGSVSGLAYIKPSPSNPSGAIKIELDNELVQGSTIEVGYKIEATNKSELDYLSENFYKYGKIDSNAEVITMAAKGIIDYLDKDWGYDQTKNEGWIEKTVEQLKEMKVNEFKVFGDEVFGAESNINNVRILYTNKLANNHLKPIEGSNKADVMLNVSKVLTIAEEISLSNETEIIEVDKPGGGTPEETPGKPIIPGNHIPGKTPEEPDSSTSEEIIVTPPTGEKSYTIYIIIGAVALVILGVGVVIIKKKVIK